MDDHEAAIWGYRGTFYCSEACVRMASGQIQVKKARR